MKPKTIRDRIENKSEQIREAEEMRKRYPFGTEVHAEACKLLDQYETELEALYELLKQEQAGGEVI